MAREHAVTATYAVLAGALAALLTLSSCAAASRPVATHVRAVSPPSPTVARPPGSDPVARRPARTTAEPDGPGKAWQSSERAFYRAGRLGEPDYAPLISSFAPGAPALEPTISFLSAIAAAGVVAPSRFRIGNVDITSSSGSEAELTGCTYDTGSVYRSSGESAPLNLGGGAGFTASQVVLHLVGGRWLVWSDQTSSVASPDAEGPCHGF